jgi:hypothetical protein
MGSFPSTLRIGNRCLMLRAESETRRSNSELGLLRPNPWNARANGFRHSN